MTRLVFVAEITGAVDSLGTLQTWYVATEGWTTTPACTPPSTAIPPHLLNPGNFRREMFAGNATFGAVRPAFGEVAIWNGGGEYDVWRSVGLDGQSFVLRVGPEGGAYPADFEVVWRCTMESVSLDFREARIRLRDRLVLLDKPVLREAFGGTGGLDGFGALKGVAKPRMFGDPIYTPVTLIDSAALTYWVADGGTDGVYSPAIYDGGMEITRGADYGSLADVLSGVPAPGACRWYVGGPQIVRLGSVPSFDVRVATGSYGSGGTWHSTGLLAELGVSDFVPGSPSIYLGGHYVSDGNTTYKGLLDSAAAVGLQWYGFDRLDRFAVGNFSAPAGVPVAVLTPDDWMEISRQPPVTGAVPVSKLVVSAGKTWPSSLAAGVSAEMRDRLSRDPWWGTYLHDAPAVLAKHALAGTQKLELTPRFQNSLAWEVFRDKFMAVFGVERDQFSVTLRFSLKWLGIDVGSVIALHARRFGLDGGRLFRVIVVRHDLAVMRTELVVWG